MTGLSSFVDGTDVLPGTETASAFGRYSQTKSPLRVERAAPAELVARVRHSSTRAYLFW